MQSYSQTVSPPTRFWETFADRLRRFFTQHPFFIRLRHWEYWPFGVVYFPIFLYWLWLSLKARSFFFFSAANPSIESGGLLGESKWDILRRIPEDFRPKTLFFRKDTPEETLLEDAFHQKFAFPLIAKPDVGERGWRVEKLENREQLSQYVQTTPGDFLLQEYVDEPLELGVFYYRMPGEPGGIVSSIVQKEFLTIRGNGRNCVEELIQQNERAILQLPALQEKYVDILHQILPAGETLTLVSIGNHSRGTKFLNANHLITPELTRLFDRISQPVDGFYFGRYDLRCRSVADLYAGKTIRILELNGAGAEPAHIYHPGSSIREAYRVLFHHWRVLYDISRANHRRGVPYMRLPEAVRLWKRIRALKS